MTDEHAPTAGHGSGRRAAPGSRVVIRDERKVDAGEQPRPARRAGRGVEDEREPTRPADRRPSRRPAADASRRPAERRAERPSRRSRSWPRRRAAEPGRGADAGATRPRRRRRSAPSSRRCGPSWTSAPRDLQRVDGRVRQLPQAGRPRPGRGRPSRPPARCSPRCCRSSTTSTGPASTATWSGRSPRWPSSSPRPLAKFGLTGVRREGRPVRPDPARGGRAPDLGRGHRADLRRR